MIMLPPAFCPPGTMGKVGNETCQPVGWSQCPSGFEPDSSGWGCKDILPETPCNGASIARLGSRTCEPLGDCFAQFPPASATHFVDDSFSIAELDETHFSSIQAAVDRAPDGAIIAVESGLYQESLVLVGRNLSLLGRCAEQTIVEGDDVERGILVTGGRVDLRGLTFRFHRDGIVAKQAAIVTVRESIVSDNLGIGIWAMHPGTSLVFEDSVARNGRPEGEDYGWGIAVTDNASMEIFRSNLENNTEAAIGAGNDPHALLENLSSLVVSDSVVQNTKLDTTRAAGYGMVALGCAVQIKRCVFAANYGAHLVVSGSTTHLSVTETVFRDTKEMPYGGWESRVGSVLDVTEASVRMEKCSAYDSIQRGIAVGWAGFVELQQTTMKSTTPNSLGFAGRALNIQDGGRIEIKDTALLDSFETAVFVTSKGSENGTSRFSAMDSLIQNTKRSTYGYGGESVSVIGASEALLYQVEMRENVLGLAVDDSAVAIDHCLIRRNEVGVHAQNGSTLFEVEEIPDSLPFHWVAVSRDTVFIDNITKVGSGVIPLPEPL